MDLKEFFKRHDSPTERQVAERIGVSVQYIYMLKHRERRPSPEVAKKLSEITGIAFEELLLPNSEAEVA